MSYVDEGGAPPVGAYWTVIWIGPLGGTWRLLITDPAGNVKLDEPTKISSAYPHPMNGFLDTLDVEVVPGTTWAKEGTADVRFSRPMKPWARWHEGPETLPSLVAP